MKQTTVESVFGTKAGVVWRALNQNGRSNITNLVKTTSMSREDVFSALGWLGREDKIVLMQKGREMIFSLRESEERLEVSPKESQKMTAGEKTPKEKPRRNKTNSLKKTKKANAVKAPLKQEEVLANEIERTKDFLL
ncbi:MAG: hypothetical protein A4E49_01844 [Methanosaeta sp. PtaU1.Bin112]|nr:MAG: hypothetical protein A4E49_01844 [Methanosaeta sp. PtaU1.Bin112]